MPPPTPSTSPTHPPDAVTVGLDKRGVRLIRGAQSIYLHPQWLRERSQEIGEIDPTNRQRLYTPLEVGAAAVVTECSVDGHSMVLSWGDGHSARLSLPAIERRIGWAIDAEEPPEPQPWSAPLSTFPYVDWADIGWSIAEENTDSVLAYLEAFYRHGYVVFRNTPTELNTIVRICDRLGYISGSNFGTVFDVRAEKIPTDLAFTTRALTAHSDLPYRQSIPGIQLLHCLRNEAPGGDSTLVDGLAASIAMAAEVPELHNALVETEVEWRYDMMSDTVINRGHTFQYDRFGRYQRITFNTKLDEPIVRPGGDLDAYYAGRHWLAQWLNDADHQVTFRLEPGDVMFMDNHRALHGRTSFDASRGARHLQGAYINHDGPDTMYRQTVRRRAAVMASSH